MKKLYSQIKAEQDLGFIYDKSDDLFKSLSKRDNIPEIEKDLSKHILKNLEHINESLLPLSAFLQQVASCRDQEELTKLLNSTSPENIDSLRNNNQLLKINSKGPQMKTAELNRTLSDREKMELIGEYFTAGCNQKSPSENADTYQKFLKREFAAGLSKIALPEPPGSFTMVIPNSLINRDLNISDTASGLATKGAQWNLTEFPQQLVLHSMIGVLNPLLESGIHGIMARSKKGQAGWFKDGAGESDDLIEPEFKGSFTPSYKRLQMSFYLSRKAGLYSPNIVLALLFSEIINYLDVALDNGIFEGSGVDPYLKGIISDDNVQEIDGSNFSFETAVNMWRLSRNADAGPNGWYIAHPDDEATLRERPITAGSEKKLIEDGKMNGIPVASSTAITKGHLYHSDFSTAVITELDPGVILIVNPYGSLSKPATIGIVAVRFVDLMLRNPASIIRCTNFS